MEEVRQPVVRRPIQKQECEVLFESNGWAAWFAVNRMVGEGRYGGPTLILLRMVNGEWRQEWRWDFFNVEGFGNLPLHCHEHARPWNLDDPDIVVPILPGQNPIEVMLLDFSDPDHFVTKLLLHERDDLVLGLPENDMYTAALQVEILVGEYCREHGIEMPLRQKATSV